MSTHMSQFGNSLRMLKPAILSLRTSLILVTHADVCNQQPLMSHARKAELLAKRSEQIVPSRAEVSAPLAAVAPQQQKNISQPGSASRRSFSHKS